MASTVPERASRPSRGEELVLEVESLAHGGRGVARVDGYVVFVSGGLPGDRVRARLVRAKRDFAEARAVDLVSPGADRVPDVCLHDGEPCPGASWQGLPYERQLAEKARQVEEALRRLGGLGDLYLEPIEPAVAQWRYRNKLEYSFGQRDGELACGFHRQGSWAEVVDADDCHLVSVRNKTGRNAVRAWGSGSRMRASFRRVQRWRSGSTGSPETSPRSAGASACSTFSAGSGRSRSSSRRARARSGGSSPCPRPSPMPSTTRPETKSQTRDSSPPTSASASARCSPRRAGPTSWSSTRRGPGCRRRSSEG